ncbi:SDR family oxidoreductase [Francisella sp. 19X1-34]|uniref:SDR family oxidoreductase n=1 Tax=Francisella sp. 19X1-34 TaxID=3087177 RepID=UPI002E329D9B|nr:SDR family oxidoreductase [Francisella sp. 19X1-34]MED7789534.1 SDR family oxidoreductase [Francisella sp. 19X1-34]
MEKRVLLITGATSGIGKATAINAAKAGFKLILTGRRENLLKELTEQIGGDKAIYIPGDITKFKDQEKVVHTGVNHWGRLDAVFANAGIGSTTPGTEFGDPLSWDQIIDTNIKGILWTAKLTLPHLKKQKGHFLLTSSGAGKKVLKGSIYGASKWFVQGFGGNLAAEMEQWGGKCTIISPGSVNTPIFDKPSNKRLSPDDVSEAVLYALNTNQKNIIREIRLVPNMNLD